MDRRVRTTDRLTREASIHKVRIKGLVRQLMPMTPLGGDLGATELAVLQRWADPSVLVKVGVKRLGALVAKESRGHQGTERAAEWISAAEAAIELYGGHPAVAFADMAAEVATEVRLLRAIGVELEAHAPAREHAYRYTEVGGLARSLPGFGEVGGPALVAIMGDPSRFARGKDFASFTGLAPRALEAQANGATFPTAHLRPWPAESSRPYPPKGQMRDAWDPLARRGAGATPPAPEDDCQSLLEPVGAPACVTLGTENLDDSPTTHLGPGSAAAMSDASQRPPREGFNCGRVWTLRVHESGGDLPQARSRLPGSIL